MEMEAYLRYLRKDTPLYKTVGGTFRVLLYLSQR